MSATGRWSASPSTGPFSPSRFKGLAQSGAAVPADAVADRLSDAFVNAAHIVEGGQRRAPLRPLADAEPGGCMPGAAADGLLDSVERPFAQRPAPRRSDLRLLPLEGFIWGARTTPPQPRTRADHVVLWITGGALQLDFPRRRLMLGPGAVQFLPAGTGFATLPLGGARGHVLLVAPELCRDITPALPDHPLAGGIGAEGPALRTTLADLAVESHREGPAARAATACHLGLLAVRLARLDPPAPRPALHVASAPDLPLVDRFLQLADAHLGSGRTVGELAEMLGAPTAVLDRACHQARGRRAIELIHDLRHEKAVLFLRGGRLSCTEIARELGYASLAHFSRAFVARTGRLPESFRG